MILKLNTSPRPDTGTQLDLVELHFEHDSWAGNRRAPHSPHFCSIRRPACAPSKNSRKSGVTAGTGLLTEDIGIFDSALNSLQVCALSRQKPVTVRA